MKRNREWRAGDWVEVRSKEEILRTLDPKGRLEETPFMPQMFEYCGQRFQVSKRAHKACDTVHDTGARRMLDAVHLGDLRCDGQRFGGCEQGCLLYWKTVWLKPVGGSHDSARDGSAGSARPACTEADVEAATRAGVGADGTPRYACQATQMPYATTPLPMWDLTQYVEDCASGNVRPSHLLASLFFLLYRNVADAGIGLGWTLRALYSVVQRLRGRHGYPIKSGKIPKNGRTPSVRLELKPGEWVRVKSHEEILATTDQDMKNRGMVFHAEMVPYCGGTYRVAKRVGRMINEKTGELVVLKNECVVLEGVGCVGRYTKPLYCPRGMFPYWREIWLERVEPGQPRRTDRPPAQDS